jgi:plasmid stability protein
MIVSVANTSGTPIRRSRSAANPAEPRRRSECHEPIPAMRNRIGIAQTTPRGPEAPGGMCAFKYDRSVTPGLASIVSNESAEVMAMATLTVRDFDDELKAGLRVRAAKHGRSMEAEVRAILRSALTKPSPQLGGAARIRQRFADLDDAALPLPTRDEPPRAAEFPE